MKDYDIPHIFAQLRAAAYLESKRSERWRNELPWWIAILIAILLLILAIVENGQ